MSFGTKEARHAEEALQARRDRREIAAGRRSGLARSEHRGCNPPDRRAEDRAGEAAEGTRDGEYPPSQGGLRPGTRQTHPAGGGRIWRREGLKVPPQTTQGLIVEGKG